MKTLNDTCIDNFFSSRNDLIKYFDLESKLGLDAKKISTNLLLWDMREFQWEIKTLQKEYDGEFYPYIGLSLKREKEAVPCASYPICDKDEQSELSQLVIEKERYTAVKVEIQKCGLSVAKVIVILDNNNKSMTDNGI